MTLLDQLREAVHQADLDAQKAWRATGPDRDIEYYRAVGRVEGLRQALTAAEWYETALVLGAW